MNRLGRANYTQISASGSGGTWSNSSMDFSVHGFDADNGYKLKYDLNGNILGMVSHGFKLNSPTNPIDALRYTYIEKTNKLLGVSDDITSQNSALGDFKEATPGGTSDYQYDVNGNLTVDNNKSISGITYNHLNLPSSISVTNKGSISYVYDASGLKLQKIVLEPSTTSNGNTATETTTTYIQGFVYETKKVNGVILYTDKLQFGVHPEGRVRAQYNNTSNPNSITGLVYDYMIKDHLGNVRMMLTEEQKTDALVAATLETATITAESSVYSNLTTTQNPKPGWFSDPLYPTNGQVARLKNASGSQNIGPAIVLKVMAGDKFNIRVVSGWNSAASSTNSTNEVLSNLLSSIAGGVSSLSSGKALQTDLINTNSGLNAGLTSFVNQQTTSGTKPKAYLNWVLLDEQFKIAKDQNGNVIGDGFSGFEQVGASSSTTQHIKTNLNVGKSGYLYIYTSNESSNIDVYFDNLQVTLAHGPMIEENHYYPFGLSMNGISGRSASVFRNKRLFNSGSELQSEEWGDGSGLDWYDTYFRQLDPQTGRWNQIDPESSNGQESISPYVSMDNNPVSLNDPLGDVACCALTAEFWASAQQEIAQLDPETQAGAEVLIVGLVIFVATYDLISDIPNIKPAPSSASGFVAGSPLGLTTGTAYISLQLNNKTVKLKSSDLKPLLDLVVKMTKKGPKDLLAEVKAQQQKEAEAKERAAKRAQASRDGKNKVGKSNQTTRGSHDSGSRTKNTSDKHDAGERRRKKDQKKADEKKAKS